MSTTFAPAAPEAEAAFLSAFLADPDVAYEHTHSVTEDYFNEPVHQHIWSAVTTLVSMGERADTITVGDRVASEHPAFSDRIYSYLAELSVNAHPPVALPNYLRILHRHRTARAMIQAGALTQTLASEYAATADADRGNRVLTQAQDAIFTVGDEAGVYDSVERIDSTIVASLDALDEQSEIATEVFATGLADLDKRLGGGMHPGEMVVIAARPGVGKSTLGMDILRHNAIEKRIPCVMFSLEMSQTDCALRVVSAEAKVPLGSLRLGSVPSDQDWEKIGTAVQRISDSPLFIDATPDVNMAYLNAQLLYLVRRHNVRIVVIDYMQLMTGDPNADRHTIVGDISRKLKIVAKKHGLLIIAIAQLNRGPEQRPDKRPQVSDLRESGQIEQDSDLIMLLYREDSFDPETVRSGEADVILGKYRHGKTGTVTIGFQGEYSRHVSLAPEAPY